MVSCAFVKHSRPAKTESDTVGCAVEALLTLRGGGGPGKEGSRPS